jgi:hypothetical protein
MGRPDLTGGACDSSACARAYKKKVQVIVTDELTLLVAI